MTISKYLNLKMSPIGRDGWKESILKLAKFFDCKPEDLFPEQHLSQPLEKNKVSFEMDKPDFNALASSYNRRSISPEDLHMITFSKDYAMKKIKERLDEREYEILSQRFGLDGKPPRTLEEIGKSSLFQKNKERIRQIEQKALKKLKALAAQDPAFRDSIRTVIGSEF
jgi:RNA polymerase primary sigma factor